MDSSFDRFRCAFFMTVPFYTWFTIRSKNSAQPKRDRRLNRALATIAGSRPGIDEAIHDATLKDSVKTIGIRTAIGQLG